MPNALPSEYTEAHLSCKFRVDRAEIHMQFVSVLTSCSSQTELQDVLLPKESLILSHNREIHTLSPHDLSHMLRARDRDAFCHVDALLPGLMVVVKQGVVVFVKAEQGELIQSNLQSSLVVKCVSLDGVVCEERAGHFGDSAALRDRIKGKRKEQGKKR